MGAIEKIGIETRARPILRDHLGEEFGIGHATGRDVDDAFNAARAFLEVELAVRDVDSELPQHEISRDRRASSHGAALQQQDVRHGQNVPPSNATPSIDPPVMLTDADDWVASVPSPSVARAVAASASSRSERAKAVRVAKAAAEAPV